MYCIVSDQLRCKLQCLQSVPLGQHTHYYKQRIDSDSPKTYIVRTNKMHFFLLMIRFNYSVFDMFRTPKCSSSGTLYMQFYGILFCIRISSLAVVRKFLILQSIKNFLTTARLLLRMHEKNNMELHVQIFLRMNTWMFETCRRQFFGGVTAPPPPSGTGPPHSRGF